MSGVVNIMLFDVMRLSNDDRKVHKQMCYEIKCKKAAAATTITEAVASSSSASSTTAMSIQKRQQKYNQLSIFPRVCAHIHVYV